jgi:hypothetical protein
LISHQGPLKYIRQPGVAEIKGQTVLFPVVVPQPPTLVV